MNKYHNSLEEVIGHLENMLESTDWIYREMLGFGGDGWSDHVYFGIIARLKEVTKEIELFKQYTNDKLDQLERLQVLHREEGEGEGEEGE